MGAPEIEVVDTREDVRLNSFADFALDRIGGGEYGTNPFEPTVSQPFTFIESADYSLLTLNRAALSYGWKTYGLVRAFLRVPVDDAFRGGIRIEIPEIDDPADLAELQEVIQNSKDLDTVKDVITWARLFGGAALLTVTDQNPASEFKPESVKMGDRLGFLAPDRWELTMSGFNNALDAYDRIAKLQYGYSYPARFNYYGVPLDETRLVRLNGQCAPSLIRQRLQGWGLSELEQCLREIQMFVKLNNVLFELVDEAKVDVYQIENFNSMLRSAQGTALVKLHIGLSNWLKNYKNALVMDAKDKYEQKQLAFSGLATIMQEFRTNLCASLRMPETKLFGQTASGFGGGEDSLENYNGMVEVEVRDKAQELLQTVVGLRAQQLWGFRPKIKISFHPMRTLNGVEEEQVNTSKQNRTLALYDRDLVNGQEASEILKKDGLLSIQTEVEKGTREPISPLEMQQEAQAQAAKSDQSNAKEKRNGLEQLRAVLDSRDRRAA